jgi:CheY-like chemotaxis protein
MNITPVNHNFGRTLLVESNDVMRRIAAEQLRQNGAAEVVAVSRMSLALKKLEAEHFDLVMYSRECSPDDDIGQDLLHTLRYDHRLAHDTVFIMVAPSANLQVL